MSDFTREPPGDASEREGAWRTRAMWANQYAAILENITGETVARLPTDFSSDLITALSIWEGRFGDYFGGRYTSGDDGAGLYRGGPMELVSLSIWARGEQYLQPVYGLRSYERLASISWGALASQARAARENEEVVNYLTVRAGLTARMDATRYTANVEGADRAAWSRLIASRSTTRAQNQRAGSSSTPTPPPPPPPPTRTPASSTPATRTPASRTPASSTPARTPARTPASSTAGSDGGELTGPPEEPRSRKWVWVLALGGLYVATRKKRA